MSMLIVRHQVEDFDRWHSGYLTKADFRAAHGVRHDKVYRSADDGNDVTVMHAFDTVDDARAFGALPDLKEHMAELGVASVPQIWFVEEA